MRVIKLVVAVLLIGGLCVVLGFQLAYQSAIHGLYTCEDVSCPYIVTLITAPLFSAILGVIACLIFIAARARKSRRVQISNKFPKR